MDEGRNLGLQNRITKRGSRPKYVHIYFNPGALGDRKNAYNSFNDVMLERRQGLHMLKA
jgi:hypothetical protein